MQITQNMRQSTALVKLYVKLELFFLPAKLSREETAKYNHVGLFFVSKKRSWEGPSHELRDFVAGMMKETTRRISVLLRGSKLGRFPFQLSVVMRCGMWTDWTNCPGST